MAQSLPVAVNLLDAKSLLSSFGTIGLAVVLFAETGLLIGIFLPGDSLLFTAGLLCATSRTSSLHLHLGLVLLAAAGGALAGAQTGYWIGRVAGSRRLFSPERRRLAVAVERTRTFLVRYGEGKALVLARFVPLVRTVINPLAGVIGVPVARFSLWQVVGGLAVVGRGHSCRLAARQPHPQHRPLSAADRGSHRRAVSDPSDAGNSAQPSTPQDAGVNLQPAAATGLSLRVPQITVYFWIAKALTTAFGESSSDYMVHVMAPELAVLIGFVAFVAALVLQLRQGRYVAWVYWLAVAMVGVFGTMCADVLHVGLHVPYVVSSAAVRMLLGGCVRVLAPSRRHNFGACHHDEATGIVLLGSGRRHLRARNRRR